MEKVPTEWQRLSAALEGGDLEAFDLEAQRLRERAIRYRVAHMVAPIRSLVEWAFGTIVPGSEEGGLHVEVRDLPNGEGAELRSPYAHEWTAVRDIGTADGDDLYFELTDGAGFVRFHVDYDYYKERPEGVSWTYEAEPPQTGPIVKRIEGVFGGVCHNEKPVEEVPASD